MRKFLRILGFIFAGLFVLAVSGYVYFNMKYPLVYPAKDIHVEATPERLERGKYLFTVSCDCQGCHSQRDLTGFNFPIIPGTEGSGGMKFDREIGVPGEVYSPNLTPAGLKDWTDGEILRAITEGIDKNGKELFPLMPYGYFKKMSEEDLYSIIAYVRSLPPVENTIPEKQIDFPLNMIIKTVPEKCDVYGMKPDKSNTVEYGKYLVNAASCNDCHSKREGPDIVPGMEFAGGVEFRVSQPGFVKSANITPDMETGIGKWTREEFINKFKQYAKPDYYPGKVGPEEFNTVMPWLAFRNFTEEDLGAIYDYLRTVTPVNNRVEKFTIDKFRN